MEPIAASVNEKWKISKAKATGIMCIFGFLLSLIFTTGSGIHWLKILDHFINNFGLVAIGLAECIILGWMYRIYRLREHANETSEILLGKWWDILIKFVIPAILIILLIVTVFNNVITNPYPEYSSWAIVLGGIAPVVVIFLMSFLLMKIKGKGVGT